MGEEIYQLTASDLELCILFLHHKADPLTQFHFDLVRKHNPRAAIVPIVDEPEGALAGAVDVSKFPSRWNTRDKWRSPDTMVYRWFENRTVTAKKYFVMEYDCFVNVDLCSYLGPYWGSDVAVSEYLTPRNAKAWRWFRELPLLEEERRKYAAGSVPFGCALISHAALEKVCKIVTSKDVNAELRFGTAVCQSGLKIQEFSKNMKAQVSSQELTAPIENPGIYHPVKVLDHNLNLRKRRLHFARIRLIYYASTLKYLVMSLGPGRKK